jgi:hypothetical protein
VNVIKFSQAVFEVPLAALAEFGQNDYVGLAPQSLKYATID